MKNLEAYQLAPVFSLENVSKTSPSYQLPAIFDTRYLVATRKDKSRFREPAKQSQRAPRLAGFVKVSFPTNLKWDPLPSWYTQSGEVMLKHTISK